MYTLASALLGAPKTNQAQVISWMLGREHGEYTDYDIAQVIVPAYWSKCLAVDLDPVLTISQMIHETGNLTAWWAGRPRRNPAGIGVTGEPGKGLYFADWVKQSIPAHVGRLLAYAVEPRRSTAAQAALIKEALKYRPLPADFRGAAPTLRGLGGRWAKSLDYPKKIVEIANAIRLTR